MFGRARNHVVLLHARTFASRHGPPPRRLEFQSRQPGSSYRGNGPPGKPAPVSDRNKDDYFPERVPRNYPPSTSRIGRKYDKEQDITAYGTGGRRSQDGYGKDRCASIQFILYPHFAQLINPLLSATQAFLIVPHKLLLDSRA